MSTHRIYLLGMLACVGVILTSAVFGESSRKYPAVRVTEPPAIDGHIRDACWRTLPEGSGFTNETLQEPSGVFDTRFWLGYDDEFIYIAFICLDPEPHLISAKETRNNAGFQGDDTLDFELNCYGSKRGEDRNLLTVNPAGAQNTRLVGGRAAQQEWQGAWTSVCLITPQGWQGEMRIPWSMFTRPNGKRLTMGINFERGVGRHSDDHRWSRTGPKDMQDRTGEWVGLELPAVRWSDPVSMLAYVSGGYSDGRTPLRTGVDMRKRFTPQLTGVLTINPDFDSVEGAVDTVDFSYSGRLTSERRPFFQEGGDLFYEGGPVRPFASVQIPQVRTGAKLYGRLGTTVNLGSLITTGPDGAYDFVSRTQAFFSPYTSVSGLVASHSVEDSNSLAFAMGAGHQTGNFGGGVNWGISSDELGRGEWAQANAWWRDRLWNASGWINYITPQVRLPIGYASHVDQEGGGGSFGYGARYHKGALTNLWAGCHAESLRRRSSGFFRDGMGVWLGTVWNEELKLEYSASRGRYEANHDHVQSINGGWPQTNKFSQLWFRHAYGRMSSSPYRFTSVGGYMRLWRRWDVSLSHEQLSHTEKATQQIMTVSCDLGSGRSVGGRLVRQAGHTNWYISLKRAGYGGMEYFIMLGDPNAESFREQILFKIIQPL